MAIAKMWREAVIALVGYPSVTQRIGKYQQLNVVSATLYFSKEAPEKLFFILALR